MGADMGLARSTSELYLPEGYESLKCRLRDIQFELLQLTKAVLILRFELQGRHEDVASLYMTDNWKKECTYFFLNSEHPEYENKADSFHPLLALLLGDNLKVDSASLTVDDKIANSLIDQTPNFVALADSWTPGEPINAQGGSYQYFHAKSTVLYGPVAVGVEYVARLIIEARNIEYLFAVMLPFGEVRTNYPSFFTKTDYQLELSPCFIAPTVSNKLPNPIQKKLDERSGERRWPPDEVRADPFRETPLYFGPTEEWTHKPDIWMVPKGHAQVFNFDLGFPPSRNHEIILTATSAAVPVRVYELLQKLPDYRDFLVTLDIFNFQRDSNLSLEVTAEILGYSQPETVHVTVMSGQEATRLMHQRKRGSREILNLVPTLKPEAVREISRPTQATLHCEVTDRQTGRSLFSESRKVVLLPPDVMIWTLKDSRSAREYHLFDFIGAWISAGDNEGLLDSVRAKARKHHPDGVLLGVQDNAEENRLQIKALYQCLSKDIAVDYVNQPFIFGLTENGQRVHPPEKVLKQTAGNCIDLVVLFASLMEGLGINPLICLVPGHAFLGWHSPRAQYGMEFLECTALQRASFEDAQDAGVEYFRNHFLFKGSDALLPKELIYMSKKSYIVDLAEAKKRGFATKLAHMT